MISGQRKSISNLGMGLFGEALTSQHHHNYKKSLYCWNIPKVNINSNRRTRGTPSSCATCRATPGCCPVERPRRRSWPSSAGRAATSRRNRRAATAPRLRLARRARRRAHRQASGAPPASRSASAILNSSGRLILSIRPLENYKIRDCSRGHKFESWRREPLKMTICTYVMQHDKIQYFPMGKRNHLGHHPRQLYC